MFASKLFTFTSFSSVAQLCPAVCDSMDCSMLGFRVHHQLQEFIQTHVCRVGEAIQPFNPLSSPSPPALNLSQRQSLSQWVSSYQVAKVLELQLHINPSNEYSGLIPFRMDWLDPLAVQGTLKSLLQHTVQKHQFFQPSLFFIVQFSHPYMTTGETIALTKMDFSWQSNVSAF